jgi:iron-sulfur cluster assembly protein
MAMARPKPQVMWLSDAAASRIKELLAKSEKPIASVRVGVKNGRCAGMAYTMEYAECVEPADEIVEDKGVRILIDPKAVLFCSGPRWTTRSRNWRPSSCSTTRTRRPPAAAANR